MAEDTPNKDILDLDALAPQPKQVILGGKQYKVLPPRFRQLLMIQRLFMDMADGRKSRTSEEQQAIIEKSEEIVSLLIPEIKDDKSIDLSFEQLMVLLKFVMTMADTGEAKPEEDKKKELESASSESLPTS